MKLDFDSLLPESRRIVLVSSDEKYRELSRRIDWMKVLRLVSPMSAPVVEVVRAILGAAAAKSEYLSKTWVGAASGGDTSAPSSSARRGFLERLTARGEIPIPHLSPEEAARRFKFDFGEPKDGAAYVLNPCLEDHYLVPALANERLAQEKVAAFTHLAASLGAKRIELVSGESLGVGGKGVAEVPIEDAAAQIGLGAKVDRGHQVTRQVFMELDEPEVAPFVPPSLARWTEIDPSLRVLANARLHAHPRTVKVVLSFGDTLDVDAKITADLAKRKIGVGGAYRRVRASRWGFEIEFWPMRRRA